MYEALRARDIYLVAGVRGDGRGVSRARHADWAICCWRPPIRACRQELERMKRGGVVAAPG